MDRAFLLSHKADDEELVEALNFIAISGCELDAGDRAFVDHCLGWFEAHGSLASRERIEPLLAVGPFWQPGCLTFGVADSPNAVARFKARELIELYIEDALEAGSRPQPGVVDLSPDLLSDPGVPF